MPAFDHLNSSLPTIFDLFKPFNEQYSHNTRGARSYVLDILTKMRTLKRCYFDHWPISIIYKFYNCNCSKNKSYEIKLTFIFMMKKLITLKLFFRSIARLLFLFMVSNEDTNMRAKKVRTFLYFSFLMSFLQYILVEI